MLKRFLDSVDGNYSVIFSIAIIPIMAGVAGAIDFAGTANDASKLQNALDATAIALGTQYYNGMTKDELVEFGSEFFASNMRDQGYTDPNMQFSDSIKNFDATETPDDGSHYIAVSSTITHPGLVGAQYWKANRSAYSKVLPGDPACVLALDPHASAAVKIQGSTQVAMNGCVIAANSNAADSVERGGSATLKAECVSTSGGTVGLSVSNVDLECGKAREHQYPSLDPLAGVTPPSYTACKSVPNGKSVTLTPGTFCDKTWSGNVTLSPGVYILRGGSIKLGGNGSLLGAGVTIFLMEGATFVADANDTIKLSPPSTGPYAGITIYQERGNTNALTMNGGASSIFSGFIYAPDAPVTYAGNNDMSGGGDCLRIVGRTVEMTGTSSVASDCAAQLGGRSVYAGRQVLLVK